MYLCEVAIVSQLCIFFPYVLHGLCEDYLTCDIAFNAVMPLSRASTRGSYSRIEGVTPLLHPHPMITRRDSATNARSLDTTFKIVLDGKRDQRRRSTRITVLMIQRRRRNLQSPLHQNLQGLHLTRRAAPRRLGHSLARKWTLRLNLRNMR